MLVYVLNKHGAPLMPCSPCKARRLLVEGKAKVVSSKPFTIQILFGSSGYKQQVTLGIDSGSKIIGSAAIGNGKTLYAGEVKLRVDITKKMQQRNIYRRNRRSRKTRYRKPKWMNRKRAPHWITPTMHSKIDAHLREIRCIESILPISSRVIETASFDIHKIVNPDVSSTKYQEGRQKDFYNAKQFVLSRDKHACQKCQGKKKDSKLHVHHIVFRSNGGTNTPDNLITLCKTCHDALHEKADGEQESLKLRKKTAIRTTDAVQVSTLGAFLKKQLSFEETFGYETKYKREKMNLPKEHYIDAICIALSENISIQFPDTLYQKTCIPIGDYQQTSGKRSEEKIPTGKIHGFRKFDKVEWQGKEFFIRGRMSTGYAILMDIQGNTVTFKPIPKMKTMKRVSARKSCLITQKTIENFPSNITSSLSVNTENSFSLSMT